MRLEVDLGGASKFTSYEDETNTFKVHSTLLEHADIGSYKISLVATFSNTTYSEEFEDSFYLTVVPDEVQVSLPAEYYFYDEWKGQIRDAWEPAEPFDPEKPVPHIDSMSQTGILTVRWDRKMQKPDNITELAEAQIAVRQESRMLDGEPVWFVNRTDSSSERAELYNAIEVKISSNDPEWSD